MPQFEFRFLVCAFLPAIPLCLIIYSGLYQYVNEMNGVVIVAVLGVVAGIVGLLVDGIRHMLESASDRFLQWFRKPKIDFAWPEITSQEAEEVRRKIADDLRYQFFLTKWTGLFHVYEFYGNFALASLIALTLLVFFKNTFSLRDALAISECWTYSAPIRRYHVLVLGILITSIPLSISLAWYCCFKKIEELKDLHVPRITNSFFFGVLIYWAVVTIPPVLRYHIFNNSVGL